MRLYRADRLIPFSQAYRRMKSEILYQPLETVGQWQSQSTDMQTRELMGATLEYYVPESMGELQQEVQPNLPWAEDHFQERIGGVPLNPPPSEQWWPFAQNGNATHKFGKDGQAEKFSHTYPERMWPKRAGFPHDAFSTRVNGDRENWGVRFQLGDLNDLIELMIRTPGTRQAYLPIWFPEDTGVVHGERVPCTLGYHFMIRNYRLHCWYYMRSCDLLRHFPDDVYMAARLMQHVAASVSPHVRPGLLTQVMSSLHTFQADDERLRTEAGHLAGTRR